MRWGQSSTGPVRPLLDASLASLKDRRDGRSRETSGWAAVTRLWEHAVSGRRDRSPGSQAAHPPPQPSASQGALSPWPLSCPHAPVLPPAPCFPLLAVWHLRALCQPPLAPSPLAPSAGSGPRTPNSGRFGTPALLRATQAGTRAHLSLLSCSPHLSLQLVTVTLCVTVAFLPWPLSPWTLGLPHPAGLLPHAHPPLSS